MDITPTLNRKILADTFVRGSGIEIGALHNPLHDPRSIAGLRDRKSLSRSLPRSHQSTQKFFRVLEKSERPKDA